MKLYELQAAQIDKQLQGVGGNIGQPKPQAPQPASPAQPPINEPDTPPDTGPTDDEKVADKAKKVDEYIMAAVKNMDYVVEYQHDDSSKIHPYKILELNFDDLSNLRNLVRSKINQQTFTDQFGLYADPGMMFYQDLITYVEKVMELKKQGVEAAENKPKPKVARSPR